jgi:ribosomal peptide maturation radical SAM protein 1
VETSRGCWWGQKHHCTFCGLNGAAMTYRSKSPERALEEIVELSRRYGRLDFNVVDNILDQAYFHSVLPRLAELRGQGFDFTFFYEVKANLSRAQLVALRDAGVRNIQPGIESLSTPILKLVRKGVSALHNIRLLKWCAELGVEPVWNLIYGFPGEPKADYDAMAELAPRLRHLHPPGLARLRLQRFSPYHQSPEAFGMKLTGPMGYYSHVYPEEAAARLAYEFAFDYADGADPEGYTSALAHEVETWNKAWRRGSPSLRWRRGPDFAEIIDCRDGGRRLTQLDGAQAAVFAAIDGGATPAQAARALSKADPGDRPVGEIRAFLDDLVERGLAYRENGVYLGLATAA